MAWIAFASQRDGADPGRHRWCARPRVDRELERGVGGRRLRLRVLQAQEPHQRLPDLLPRRRHFGERNAVDRARGAGSSSGTRPASRRLAGSRPPSRSLPSAVPAPAAPTTSRRRTSGPAAAAQRRHIAALGRRPAAYSSRAARFSRRLSSASSSCCASASLVGAALPLGLERERVGRLAGRSGSISRARRQCARLAVRLPRRLSASARSR